MLPAILEKLSFGVAALVLYAQGRVAPLVVGAGLIDLLLAGLFVLAFRASRSVEESARNPLADGASGEAAGVRQGEWRGLG
jgi:hypothetical protein